MIVDVGAMPDDAEKMPNDGYCKRLVPMSVDRFAATIREKKFTNNADVELVIGLYKKTLESVLGKAPKLTMVLNKHWGDAEMRELVEVLPLCAEATELVIAGSFHEVTAEGVGVLGTSTSASTGYVLRPQESAAWSSRLAPLVTNLSGVLATVGPTKFAQMIDGVANPNDWSLASIVAPEPASACRTS